jgi:hypothetical protein
MNQIKPLFTKCTLLLFAVSLLSCTEPKNTAEQTPPEPPKPAAQKVVLEGDDIVLARVAGEPITRYDLEQTIQSTLGEASAGRLDEAGRKKILESLVAGRAIAQAQEAALKPEEIAEIDKKTQAYREQLLVKQYLAKHAAPQPVTQDMVRDYYQAHPERFGGRTIRSYEMLAGKRQLKTTERDDLIKAMQGAAVKKDWQQWVQSLQQQGYPIELRQGQVDEKLLHPRLRQLMMSLQKGQTSQLSFIEGQAYIIRVVDEKQLPPRPLNEVSAQIRKALVPVQLKKAVKQASDQVLQTTEVIYEEQRSGKETKSLAKAQRRRE